MAALRLEVYTRDTGTRLDGVSYSYLFPAFLPEFVLAVADAFCQSNFRSAFGLAPSRLTPRMHGSVFGISHDPAASA
jgi:hypothetical protein